MGAHSQIISVTLWARGGKRFFDVVAAALLLIVTLPLWLPAAMLVKLTSRGPLFFMQDRAGKDGRIFQPYKFRTMRGGRTPDPTELVPLNHPEVTAIGRWLRRLKVDELPQLLNVLTGEMSLVGPRPTLPDQAAAYDDFRRQRLLIRPGLTGLAQVHGNTTISWDERILFDVAYVRHSRLSLDLWILWRTVLVVLLGESRLTCPFRDSRFAGMLTPPEGYYR